MAVDLKERSSDANNDVDGSIQRHYDDKFNRQTSPEHATKDGKSGDSDGGFYNPQDDTAANNIGQTQGGQAGHETSLHEGKGFWNASKEKQGRFRKGLGKFTSKKWLLGLGIGGSGILFIVLIVFLLLSTLKIPHLMENITGYQMARVTATYRGTTKKLLAEKIAVAAARNAVYQQYKAKYDRGATNVAKQWSRLDKFRPNKIISNWNNSGLVQIRPNDEKPKSIKIKNANGGYTTYRINAPTTVKKRLKEVIPGFKLAREINFATKVAPQIAAAAKADAFGPIVRGATAKQIRERLGVSLVAWKVGQYRGKNASQIRIAVEQDTAKKVYGTRSAGEPRSQKLKDALRKAIAVNEEAFSDENRAKEIISNGGIDEKLEKTVANELKLTTTQKAIGVANDTYLIASALCIVYDGSLDDSGGTIKDNSDSQQRAYYHMASVADQQKEGLSATPEIIGAYNDKLGDVQGTVPESRANGKNIDTSGIPSAQAGAGGTFSLLNATFGNSSAIDFANKLVEPSCNALTNLYVAGGIAVASIIADGILAFFTGGTATAAKRGVTVGLTKTISHFITKKIGSMFTKQTLKAVVSKAALKKASNATKNVSKRTMSFMWDLTKSSAKIAGATVLAHFYVASKSGYLQNGFAQNSDFVNMVDAGGNAAGNEIMQKQFYGRPLNKDEANQSHDDTIAMLRKENAAKPLTERYFAISNPQSLVSRLAYNGLSLKNTISGSSLIERLANILDPSKFMSTVANAVLPNKVGAASAQDGSALFYGNVQRGWSNAEEALVEDDPTYQYLENQYLLDESGKESEINDKYSECFTEHEGDLLAEGKIVRDENANVISDEGLCSPKNLGINNSEYGDLVFRWRVAHRYDGAMTQLEEMQVLTEESTLTDQEGSKFRVASYNVLGKSHRPGDWQARAAKVVDNIRSQNIDIIGYQELEPAQRDYVDSHLSDYKRSTHGKDSDSIMWRTSCTSGATCTSFTKVSQGTWTTTYFGGRIEEPWVKLRDNATGQEVHVMNVHDPINRGQGSPETRYQNALKHLAQIRKLQSDAPVVLTGDFNNGFTKSDGAGTPTDQKTAYCVLTSSGLMDHTYDLSTGRAEKCPNPLPQGSDIDSKIDHIYVSSGMQATSYFDINKPQSASDHVAIVSDVVIPSSSGAGTDFIIGTYNHPNRGNPQVAYSKIKESKMDVVGMQEIGNDNYAYLKSNLGKDGYGVWPNVKNGEAKSYFCAYARPVFYDAGKFNFVKGEVIDVPSYAHKTEYNEVRNCGNGGEQTKGGGQLNLPIVWLQDAATGQTIIVMNTHNLASCCGAVNAPKKRFLSAQIYINKIRELNESNPGVPIFFTGDFNEGTGVRTTRNVTYQFKHQNLLYCMFKENKLMFKALGSKDQPCKTDHESIGQVDFVYATPGVKVEWEREFLDPSTNDSPHPVHFGRVVVPGSGDTNANASKKIEKVLVIVEENHSYQQMKVSMPYTMSLARKYGYATNYKATTHPSLPNYIAITGGKTFDVNGNGLPSAYNVTGTSVFGQAISRGKTAKLYAESMQRNCDTGSDSGLYRTKHNPWAYFKNERQLCNRHSVPFGQFGSDVAAGKLPSVGMVVPNMCNDAHDCSLRTADDWFKARMQDIFDGPDWKSGRLAVILTADEDNRNPANGNDVLTVVIHPSLDGKVVSQHLTHYSLSKLYSEVVGASGVSSNVRNATSLAESFGLPL